MKIQCSSLRRVLALVLTGLLLVVLCVYFLVTRPNLPWTKALQTADVFGVATSDDRLPKRLESYVRKIVTKFSPRDSGHAANLAAVSAYIRAELSSLSRGVIVFRAICSGWPNKNEQYQRLRKSLFFRFLCFSCNL